MEKLRVLLADDHAIIRDGLKQILADTEDLAVCGEAANGNEALLLVREQEWDVIVLDISMPGRSGLDLIRLIRDEKPKLPILILSMHHEEQYAVRALHAGASGYLTKESDAELLVQAIRRVAHGGVYVSDTVAQLIARGLMPAANELPHTTLSDREYQIFHRLVLGQGLTDIANELSLSVKTISTHKTRILQKMSMTNTSELIRYAVAHHLVKSTDV
ncbi:two component transcriptional regulator, LuxR family [Aromatoleum tolulyticum]|uniref:Two component transcriptional regulator, LuxR family n=1 Tax=Aromatoleum tolulyticum TaxID=34027 RepID=A0A1N7B6G0_9RHOO|nr:response regulator transcription factor [Aromatoleum tolulyticum]SIR46837.1 two component transcriptional regulator, LuxR family [Aromatoleum tolulyticum]